MHPQKQHEPIQVVAQTDNSSQDSQQNRDVNPGAVGNLSNFCGQVALQVVAGQRKQPSGNHHVEQQGGQLGKHRQREHKE